ncbi:MAG TPA: hypothetical protein VK438_01985, partial [Xanthobacteraceae bacterium]|nr:hypothetical protein [Xanthobacteraceae bacterium]
PWSFDLAADQALQLTILRRPAILRYASFGFEMGSIQRVGPARTGARARGGPARKKGINASGCIIQIGNLRLTMHCSTI